jgi:replicative DNA helicase Mcm
MADFDNEQNNSDEPKILSEEGEGFESLDDVSEFDDSGNPLVRKLEHFLNKFYKKELDSLIEEYPDKISLVIDFPDLELYDPNLADQLLKTPDLVIESIKIAAKNYTNSLLGERKDFDPFIRIRNFPEDSQSLIKHLSADHISKIVILEGIVRQFTTVMPKIKVAHWICRKCGYEVDTMQEDVVVSKPGFCPECRHKDFDLDEKNSQFIDYQKIEIQELLERLKGGEQSNTINVIVSGDLVNKFTAGDRILVSGILRLRKPDKKQTLYGRYLDVLYIEDTKQDYDDVEVTPEDFIRIKDYSKNPRVYDILRSSIAPNIYGHEMVKDAIVFQLFGGTRKELANNSKLRGNIHVLLIGDPGVGKSVMLQYATQIAPKSVYVVGKTSSGAGLTASAVKDEFGEGGWTLKAGALVLASGGFAMVDEFDKMSHEDRSAMHEAMEQETVSIAKAGIVTSFKTETTVLAAANPKYGRFDNYKTIPEQIEIPPTLLSRFDLFFVLKDVLDEKRDKETVTHILNTHEEGQQRKGMDEYQIKDLDKTQMEEREQIDIDLLKKYIAYARTNIFPILTKRAKNKIRDFYIDLRRKSQDGRVTITFRQLEALVRLSEASARVRLSAKVEEFDAIRAISIFQASMEQFGLDPETGTFDIDIISTGQSHSQKTKMRKILEIIEKLSLDGEHASFDKIVEEADGEGIGKEIVREFIDKLLKSGDIYEPKPFKYATPKRS